MEEELEQMMEEETEVNEPAQQPKEEQPAEEQNQEPPKVYSEQEFKDRLNEAMTKRAARSEAKIRREQERKFAPLMEILRAGTGKESLEDITEVFREHYKGRTVQPTAQPKMDQRDLQRLAQADAEEIIGAGDEEVEEELERLNDMGETLTERERLSRDLLQKHQSKNRRVKELERLGVTADTYNSKEFRDFEKQFNADTPVEKIWQFYSQIHKKTYQTMGSMKQEPAKGPKDHYTPEEIERLTEEELDDPKVWEAVRRSMTGR